MIISKLEKKHKKNIDFGNIFKNNLYNILKGLRKKIMN